MSDSWWSERKRASMSPLAHATTAFKLQPWVVARSPHSLHLEDSLFERLDAQ